MKRTSSASRQFVTFLFVVAAAICFVQSGNANAANVRYVGTVGYSYAGNVATLTADQVINNSTSGISGTLQMELWAFATPYTGAAQAGYKLANYSLGQLTAGFVFNNINSGAVPFGAPPNGTWIFTLVLTEFTNGSTDGGYDVRDWRNFTNPVVIGPPTPPPPAVTPQIGLWWNPNESGTGYAFDYKHGVLVVTTYSYEPNGLAQWYLSSGPLSGYTFVGTLDRYFGGQCIACGYAGRPINTGSDGTITIIFSSATSATVYLPGGRVTVIQPQAF